MAELLSNSFLRWQLCQFFWFKFVDNFCQFFRIYDFSLLINTRTIMGAIKIYIVGVEIIYSALVVRFNISRREFHSISSQGHWWNKTINSLFNVLPASLHSLFNVLPASLLICLHHLMTSSHICHVLWDSPKTLTKLCPTILILKNIYWINWN